MAHAAVPPLLRCTGIRAPSSRALQGIYEFQGVVDSRPCYHQTGVSNGNHLWFTEDTHEGPMWVITPKDAGVNGSFDGAIAKSHGSAWWPWETESWSVCGKRHRFTSAPDMAFKIVAPAAELRIELRLPLMRRHGAEKGSEEPVVLTFRGSEAVHGRPAYREHNGRLRLFWMPIMSRWLLAKIKTDKEGGGIQYVVVRSKPDDGSTWSSWWPWEHLTWEMPTRTTHGLEDGEAKWVLADQRVDIRLVSPPVAIDGDPMVVPRSLAGRYEPRGMAHGRVYYVQRLEDVSLENSVGPKCLWFAEDRGQWVLTDPVSLGDSTEVLARVANRAWWPWEAHLAGTTSPASLGSAPFARLPEWHGGATILAAGRAGWQVAEHNGGFREAKDMAVSPVFPKEFFLKAHPNATHPFLGFYDYVGMLSTRPYFMQRYKEKPDHDEPTPVGEFKMRVATFREKEPPGATKELRFVLWYAEELEQWVITEDFRLLDFVTVDAKVQDSAWFPWDVPEEWEISDKVGGFCKDPYLCAELPRAVVPGAGLRHAVAALNAAKRLG